MTLSLDEMIEAMHTHARAVLIGDEKAQVLPFFHVQFKDLPDCIVPAPFQDERTKSMFIAAIKATLKLCRPSVVNYAFVSECWMLRQDHPPRNSDLLPSQSERRIECLVVSAGDHQGGKIKMWEIVRDDKGRPSDLVEDKQDYDNFGGRLTNLLNDD